jgi:hypothetical protein
MKSSEEERSQCNLGHVLENLVGPRVKEDRKTWYFLEQNYLPVILISNQ